MGSCDKDITPYITLFSVIMMKISQVCITILVTLVVLLNVWLTVTNVVVLILPTNLFFFFLISSFSDSERQELLVSLSFCGNLFFDSFCTQTCCTIPQDMSSTGTYYCQWGRN